VLDFFWRHGLDAEEKPERGELGCPTLGSVMGPNNLWKCFGPFATGLVEKIFLDGAEDKAISSFHSSVGLRVIYRSEVDSNAKESAKLFELLGVKLPAIIYSKLPGDPEPANNVLPNEAFDRSGHDVYHRLCFDPAGKVLYREHCVFVVALSGREGFDNVNAPPLQRSQVSEMSCEGCDRDFLCAMNF
jgi:hypothetical protein